MLIWDLKPPEPWEYKFKSLSLRYSVLAAQTTDILGLQQSKQMIATFSLNFLPECLLSATFKDYLQPAI